MTLLAIVAIHTAANEPPKVRQVMNKIHRNVGPGPLASADGKPDGKPDSGALGSPDALADERGRHRPAQGLKIRLASDRIIRIFDIRMRSKFCQN